jgi:hypothetical protein
LVLRLTWTIAELIMIAGLLLGHRKTTKGNESTP